jgi:hypothetical protein
VCGKFIQVSLGAHLDDRMQLLTWGPYRVVNEGRGQDSGGVWDAKWCGSAMVLLGPVGGRLHGGQGQGQAQGQGEGQGQGQATRTATPWHMPLAGVVPVVVHAVLVPTVGAGGNQLCVASTDSLLQPNTVAPQLGLCSVA